MFICLYNMSLLTLTCLCLLLLLYTQKNIPLYTCNNKSFSVYIFPFHSLLNKSRLALLYGIVYVVTVNSCSLNRYQNLCEIQRIEFWVKLYLKTEEPLFTFYQHVCKTIYSHRTLQNSKYVIILHTRIAFCDVSSIFLHLEFTHHSFLCHINT